MRSTFMGLEASKRGLFTQQSALYTTGHNLSNANTAGYTRQRINMQPTEGYPGIGLNAPKTPGFIGTGVEAGSVQRIREAFVDRQFRQETTKLGYWDSQSKAISQMEDILAEPSDYGLNESLNQFWMSLQGLSESPENSGTRKVVGQRAMSVAESFNYIHKQLTEIQGNLKSEINVSVTNINSILNQIASFNENIQSIEPNGYMPNDLYDARDSLIDELSTYFPIDIEYTKSGGNALAIAEGAVNISIKTAAGNIKVVNGKDFAQLSTALTDKEGYEDFGALTFTGSGEVVGGAVTYENLEGNKGKLLSLINSYGHGAAKNEVGYYPDMLKNLDKMAKAFADEFNKIHKSGTDLSGNQGLDLFVAKPGATIISASTISVDQKFIDNPNLIAASTSASKQEGNGANALLLAKMKFNSLTDLNGSTIQTFYQSLIGQMGVDGEQAGRLTHSSETNLLSVTNKRASISSVSLDEELTNMIMFQQAYNANARMITVVDETLDKIINGMGRVGN